jgi:hypothetical protein
MVDDWYKRKSRAYCQKPSMKPTGMTGNPVFLTRTATPRSGAKFRRKICPPFFRISFQCAGIASSRKTAGASIPNGWWIADGNAGEWRVCSQGTRGIFRRNQPAATKRALNARLARPHLSCRSLTNHRSHANLRCKHPSQRNQPTKKHPALVPPRSR